MRPGALYRSIEEDEGTRTDLSLRTARSSLTDGLAMAMQSTLRPRHETPFVGRDIELDGLSSILRQVLRGKPRVAVVCGESGVGKSRLVREFAAIARRLDVHVTQGRAIEDSSVPYLPLMAILRSRAPVAIASLTDG